MSRFKQKMIANTSLAAMSLSALFFLNASATPAKTGSLTRQVSVNAAPEAVWSRIGGFCSIKDWHPLVGVCITDGKRPPTRTLVTRDGQASFVEKEMARDDSARLYSYSFVSSPLPTTKYLSTLRVVSAGPGTSLIVWHGEFSAEPGKEKDVEAALVNVYESGLTALKARFSSH